MLILLIPQKLQNIVLRKTGSTNGVSFRRGWSVAVFLKPVWSHHILFDDTSSHTEIAQFTLQCIDPKLAGYQRLDYAVLSQILMSHLPAINFLFMEMLVTDFVLSWSIYQSIAESLIKAQASSVIIKPSLSGFFL